MEIENGEIEKSTERDLRFAFFVTLGVLVIQLIGFYFSNSLSLLSDSGHVFSDVLALAVSFSAFRLALTAHTTRRTFGFHRAEVFSAIFNGLLLVAMAVLIIVEAFARLTRPFEINSLPMLFTAIIGLIGNLWVASRLEKNENLNIKSAFLHASGDALSSLGVIIAAIVIFLTGFTLIDPLISFFIVAVISTSAYRLIRNSLSILFESAPRTATPDMVNKIITSFKEVKETHDVHVWSICSDIHYVTAHIVIENNTVSKTKSLVDKINKRLKSELGIGHTTFQLEDIICKGNVCYTWHSK